MSKDPDVQTKAYEEIRRHQATILKPYVDGEDYTGASRVLELGDLDRSKPDRDMYDELNKTEPDKQKLYELSSEYAGFMSDQRTRRDMLIGRTGHKRLMYGCLETLYRRERKLEQLVSKVKSTDVKFDTKIPDTLT